MPTNLTNSQGPSLLGGGLCPLLCGSGRGAAPCGRREKPDVSKTSPSHWAQVRCRVEDGKIRVGSSAHVALLDYERSIGELSKRSQTILRLAMQGWSHQLIADQLGVSRSRISHIVADFELSMRDGSS